MTLAPNISKTLLDITGEPRVEMAIYALLKDAIEHWIEKIEAEIKKLEEKYRMPFQRFKDEFMTGRLPDASSFRVESDFLEWEGLIARLGKYRSSLASLA